MNVHLCPTTAEAVIKLLKFISLQCYISLSSEITVISCEAPSKASNEGL